MPQPSHPQESNDLGLLIALAVGQMVAWGTTYYLYAVLLDAMRTDLGLTRSAAAAPFGMGLLVAGLAAPLVGVMIDRGRHFLVLVGGSALCVAGLLMHAAVASYWQLFAVWIVIGLGMAGTLYDPVFAFLIRSHPRDFRRRITIVTLLGGLASTLFWPISAWLVSLWGWRIALLVLAGAHGVFCLANHAWWVPRRDVAANSICTHASSARGHLRSPVFVGLAVAFVLQTLVLGALAAHVVSLLEAFGVVRERALLAASSVGIMQVAGRVILLAVESRAGAARTTNLVIWMLPASIGAMFAVGTGDAPLLVFAFLYGTGNGMMTIVKGTAVAELVSQAHVATLNGALALPTAAARAAGPFVLALIWDFSGDFRFGLGAMLVLAVAAALALAYAHRYAQATPVEVR